jgi:hypothetical protein
MSRGRGGAKHPGGADLSPADDFLSPKNSLKRFFPVFRNTGDDPAHL